MLTAGVARRGEEFAENARSTVLDAWLKAMVEKRGAKNELKPANLYQGCVYAWNAHRERKSIQNIKHDPKKVSTTFTNSVLPRLGRSLWPAYFLSLRFRRAYRCAGLCGQKLARVAM